MPTASSGTVTFLFQPDYGVLVSSPAMAVVANGMASFSIATLDAHNYTVTAMYNGTPAGAGVTGFGTSTADATALVVNPVMLSATAGNVTQPPNLYSTGPLPRLRTPTRSAVPVVFRHNRLGRRYRLRWHDYRYRHAGCYRITHLHQLRYVYVQRGNQPQPRRHDDGDSIRNRRRAHDGS